MKKALITLIAAALILGLGYWKWRPQPLPVSLHSLSKGSVESTVANTRAGAVRACQRSKLSMPTGGAVSVLHVKAGDRVQSGQLLLELWNKDLRALHDQARAGLSIAERKKAEICFGAERDQRELQRQQTLASKKLSSEDILDAARTQAGMSALACKAAAAQIEESQAVVALQAAQLERSALRAPFSGVIAEINGEIGEYVTPSPPGVPTPPAVDLIDDSCLYVRAPIDEVDTARIKVGMPARVTLDAFRGRALQAKVTRVAPYVQEYEKQARTVDVEVEINEFPEDMNLLVGYSADIEVIIDSRDNVLRLPTEMILEGDAVLKFDPNDQSLHKVAFQGGIGNWVYTEVVSGLNEGDRVLAALGQEGAEDGAQVRPQP
ncbi:Membrane-fusion protein [Hahella chejuensis KCTC 2396]|uniref:Membrane-fusion protein n=1 Tax=Hahella chejuensis (strain KCTC 2396) TaxID=349521 RepID=Q2SMJ1_HAHCH|nr:efflux RND transporter periplasmic adaptor subunit [Hahella chejuensis]ABC28133.1 Membrane-fusion protein [Hahella chejuensis KCTC 2396]